MKPSELQEYLHQVDAFVNLGIAESLKDYEQAHPGKVIIAYPMSWVNWIAFTKQWREFMHDNGAPSWIGMALGEAEGRARDFHLVAQDWRALWMSRGVTMNAVAGAPQQVPASADLPTVGGVLGVDMQWIAIGLAAVAAIVVLRK